MQFIVLVFVVSGKDSTPGPRLAMSAILGAVEDKCLVMMGIVCSSFVVISSGTHGRTPFMPLGNTQYESVRNGNTLASRTLGCSSYLSCFIVWFANACEALYIEDMHACMHAYIHIDTMCGITGFFMIGLNSETILDGWGRFADTQTHPFTKGYPSFLSFLPGNSLSTDLQDMDAHVGVFLSLVAPRAVAGKNCVFSKPRFKKIPRCIIHCHVVLKDCSGCSSSAVIATGQSS